MDGEVGKGGTKIAIMERRSEKKKRNDIFFKMVGEKSYGPELKSPGGLIVIGRSLSPTVGLALSYLCSSIIYPSKWLICHLLPEAFPDVSDENNS